MPEARDRFAADAFVSRSRSIRELAATIGASAAAEEHLRNLVRLAFLQGWHEAMVARDGDDEIEGRAQG